MKTDPPKVELDNLKRPELNRTRIGGKLVDLPKPHHRLSDIPGTKKEVTVTISKFYGIGVHFHVSIREDSDYIWDHVDGVWAQFWDDAEGKGKYFSEKFDTKQQADDFVRQMKDEHFPSKSHVLVNSTGYKRWHYRQGD